MHRLYLDEAGDHTSSHPKEIGKKYLGLTGVIVDLEQCHDFQTKLENFKREHLPYDPDEPPILHREDILAKRYAFKVLLDPDKHKNFDQALLALMQDLNYTIITVVINKITHWTKTYRTVSHPYHYCLEALLERYCDWLKANDSKGDILAESRGGKEDELLKIAYSNLYKYGTRYISGTLCKERLTSKELKLKKKERNIAGLQIADLLAHPLKRDVLFAYCRVTNRGGKFADKICQIARTKYRCSPSNKIRGWGQVILG